MKKKLIGLLASLACLACFAGCNNPLYSGDVSSPDNGNPAQSSSSVDGAQSYDVKGAAEYIADMYKAQDSSGRTDYKVAKKVLYDGAAYTIAWSVNVDCVKIVEQENDILVDVDEDSEVEVKYVLTATVTAPDGSTETVTVNRTLEAAPSVVPQPITSAPSENETYKLYMYQVTKKADLYFTGKMSDYYLATTNHSNGEDYTKGVDIKVKKVEGKDSFYLTFIDPADSSGTKVQYIGVINNYSNGKWRYNAVIGSSPEVQEGVTGTYEFTYSAEHGTMIATLEGVKSGEDEKTTETSTDSFYLGTYSGYWTIGASSVSRIKDEDACIACLAVMQDKSTITPEKKVESEKNALSLQTNHTGAVSLDLPVKGATYSDVSISWAVKSGDAKVENGKLVVAAPSATTEIVLTATVKCGEVSENVEFTLTVYAAASSTVVTTPEEDVAYAMYLYQGTLGKNYYLTGEKDGNFLATSDKASNAAKVYAEAADGGYKFYVKNGDTKSYIALTEYQKEGKNYYSASIDYASEGSVFHYDDLGCWAADLANDTFFIGTYQSFTTVSASSSYYMTEELMGKEQFPVVLATYTADMEKPDDEGEKPGEGEKPNAGNVVTAPVADTAYLMFLEQKTLGSTLYLTGKPDTTNSKFLGMTANASEAAYVYAEVVDGGYKFYVLDENDAKSYIELTEYQKEGESYYRASIAWSATGSVFHYEDIGCWAADLANDTFFIGTYQSFNTSSASSSFYMTADKFASQYPLQLVLAENVDVTPPDDGGNEGEKPVVPTTPAEIVDAAWALASGAALEGSYTLTGVITELGTYNASYKDINVTFVVEGKEDKPMYCYALKGSTDGQLAVGDTITVTGSIKNYNGTVEFDKPNLDKHVAGEGGEAPDDGGNEGEKPVVPTTPAEIVDAAWALASGAALEGSYTLTGVITVAAFNSQYSDYNVTIVVEGKDDKPMYCYGLKGATEGQLAVGDTITVTGSIKNYNGTVEFYMPNLDEHVAGEGGEVTPPETPETPDDGGDVVDPDATSITWSVADHATENNWTNATLYESVTLSNGTILSVDGTPVGNYSKNTGKYYTKDITWRIYQSENATLTITAAEGKTIASVKVSYIVDKTGILSHGETQIASDEVVTVNANSITFGVANTGDATNGQVRITAIEIVYA